MQMDKNKEHVANIPDYYWRDYIGVIPNDAVQGGYDITGKYTYIGQAFFKNYGLLPGTIRSGCRLNLITTASKEILIADNHIKVLCSGMLNKMRWITTNQEQFVELSGHHFVVGGYIEPETVIYIGRTRYDTYMATGNICVNKNFAYGLAIPYVKGNSQLMLSNFDILTYGI